MGYPEPVRLGTTRHPPFSPFDFRKQRSDAARILPERGRQFIKRWARLENVGGLVGEYRVGGGGVEGGERRGVNGFGD